MNRKIIDDVEIWSMDYTKKRTEWWVYVVRVLCAFAIGYFIGSLIFH